MAMKIQNIIATDECGHMVNLDDLSIANAGIEYDPAMYPAARLRVTGISIVVTVYKSGKMISVGAKTFEQCRVNFEIAKKLCSKYKMISVE